MGIINKIKLSLSRLLIQKRVYEMDIPSFENLTSDIIDETDDLDLDMLVFNHISLLADKRQKTINQTAIELGSVHLTSTALAMGYNLYEFNFETDLIDEIELLPYMSEAYKLVNCESLVRFFDELNTFFQTKYKGKLPFNLMDEDCETLPEFEELEKQLSPFAKAYKEIIESENLDLLQMEADFIRAHKTEFAL